MNKNKILRLKASVTKKQSSQPQQVVEGQIQSNSDSTSYAELVLRKLYYVLACYFQIVRRTLYPMASMISEYLK